MRPIPARIALARHACRLAYTPAEDPAAPSTNSATVEPGTRASGECCDSYAARRRNMACRPLALGPRCTPGRLPGARPDDTCPMGRLDLKGES